MDSKLTPELSVALDRAMTAAGTDPLVEALDALRSCVDAWEGGEIGDWRGALDAASVRARDVLSKYRPVSESDTQNC